MPGFSRRAGPDDLYGSALEHLDRRPGPGSNPRSTVILRWAAARCRRRNSRRCALNDAWPCRPRRSIRFDPLRVHALGKDQRTSRRCGRSFSETKNLCVWSKTNAGMDCLCSRHELDLCSKRRCAAHQLRTRPFRPELNERLGLSWPERPERHVEEQAVAAPHGQARRPCRRCDSALFQPQRRAHPRSFRGAGTTLIAAEKTGRTAADRD